MSISRKTRQKDAMERELNSFDGLFGAEELYNKVSRKNKDIGIATIYRYLKDLKKNGKIHHYVCGKNTIYSRSHVSHSHFTCEKCGKKIHLENNKIDLLKEKLPGKACHIQIDIHGTCNECLKNNS